MTRQELIDQLSTVMAPEMVALAMRHEAFEAFVETYCDPHRVARAMRDEAFEPFVNAYCDPDRQAIILALAWVAFSKGWDGEMLASAKGWDGEM